MKPKQTHQGPAVRLDAKQPFAPLKLLTEIKTMAHVGKEFVFSGIFVLIVVKVDGPLVKGGAIGALAKGGGCC